MTAAGLFVLLNISYVEYHTSTPDDERLHFDEWCQKMATEHPQFDYWHKVLQLEILFLQFMRAQQEGQFDMYVESLGKIIPWMFALDHYHYARRMTVHVKDLLALPTTCPSVQDEFVAGHFVTQKSHHKFSALAHDQIHEQLNAMVKCDGGVVGITENEAALKHWMVAGPEMDRLLTQYEDKHTTQKKVNPRHQRHHEQIPSIQKTFFTNVEGVVTAMEEMGTPFSDASDDLYALDTKVEMPAPVVESIKTAEALGKRQYQKFVDERLNDNIRTFYDTIQKNKLPLFASFDATPKTTNKTAACTSGLKTDIHLFSRMYISCQARALASNSIMHQTTKSDLVQCLESLVPPNQRLMSE